MEKSSLRVVSWNVNGLRAVLKNTGNDLRGFLDSLEADIICLQETKATSQSVSDETHDQTITNSPHSSPAQRRSPAGQLSVPG